MTEEAYEKKATMLAMSQDISKAYGNVERHLALEMALRRLGVPEDIIDLFLDIHDGNSVEMLTAYGSSKQILGEVDGTFEALRGIAQGGSEGPLLWVALYDVLIRMQEDELQKYAPCYVQSTTGRIPLAGWAFADDAIWMASSRDGLNHRCSIAELYFEFLGMTFNVGKSKVIGMEWHGETYECAEKGGYKPCIYDLDRYFNQGIKRPAR